MSKPTLSLLNAKNLFIASILLAGAAFTACDEDKKSDPECVQECLSEEYAKICLDGKEDLQTCTAGQKCYAGSCQAASNSLCDSQPPECVTDASYRLCAWGTWSQPIPCEPGAICQNGLCSTNQNIIIPNTSTCQESVKICSDDLKGYKVCASGNWSQVFPCSDGTVCSDGECVVGGEKCTATQPECTADNKGYRVCVSGIWSNPILCTGTATCKNGQCSGEDITSKLPCKEVGEQKCVSKSRIQICGQDNFWQFMDCPADVPVCEDDECVPANCTNGEVKCSGDNELATCTGNSWEYMTCPADKPVCRDNQCVVRPKECNPGVDKKCVSGNQVQICNQYGSWENGNFCSGSTTCLNGECLEKCSPGDKKCVTDTLAYFCNVSGFWEEKTCTGTDICSDGECRACKEGQTRCKDSQTVETCTDGTWKSSTCDYYYCSQQEGKCLNPDDKCSGVSSYCLDNTLAWCSGTQFHTMTCLECLIAKDKSGANCSYNNLASTAAGKRCSSEGLTSQGAFAENSHYNNQQADCIQCKRMSDGYLLWVPVAESNCK